MKTESNTTTPKLERERDEAQAKLKEAKGAMNDAIWQLMSFLKPHDEKTLGIIKKLEEFVK